MQVDGGKCGWELPEIGGGRSDQAGELSERPVRRRDWRIRAGEHQRQPLRIVAIGLDLDQRAFHHAGPAAIGAVAHRLGQLRQGR